MKQKIEGILSLIHISSGPPDSLPDRKLGINPLFKKKFLPDPKQKYIPRIRKVQKRQIDLSGMNSLEKHEYYKAYMRKNVEQKKEKSVEAKQNVVKTSPEIEKRLREEAY